MLAELCYNLSQEPAEKYEPPDPMRDTLKEVVPEGYAFEKRKTWAGMTLWLFKGEKLGQIRETLVAVRWKGDRSSPVMDLPLIAMKHCCQWAAEISLNSKLSGLSTSLAKPEEMGIVAKDENGQYRLSHPFVRTSESTREDGKEKEHSFSLSLRDLLTVGEQIGNFHCVSLHDTDNPGDGPPVRVSVVSRAVSLGTGEGFMVFAGATEGTPDKFWYITQTVDKLVDECGRRVRHDL
jgi:hypothetical protein